MEESNTEIKTEENRDKIPNYILYTSIALLLFILGMGFEKSIMQKENNRIIKQFVDDTNLKIRNSIQKHKFFSASLTNLDKNSSIVLKGEYWDLHPLFYDVIVPALQNHAVCFTNILNDSTNNNIIQDFNLAETNHTL